MEHERLINLPRKWNFSRSILICAMGFCLRKLQGNLHTFNPTKAETFFNEFLYFILIYLSPRPFGHNRFSYLHFVSINYIANSRSIANKRRLSVLFFHYLCEKATQIQQGVHCHRKIIQ